MPITSMRNHSDKNQSKPKVGVLLTHLGTPSHYHNQAVRCYLKEFLNDPYVIPLPRMIRWILVNGFLIPWRYKQSASAYKKIWYPTGSPLLVHSLHLANALALQLGQNYQVVLGMRYGKPSISSALRQLNQCHALYLLPLFPQYSAATTHSTLDKCFDFIMKSHSTATILFKKYFYNEPQFIHAYATYIKQILANQFIDLLLFSYHGLPVKHLQRTACHPDCDPPQPCSLSLLDAASPLCYRAQCYATTQQIAVLLNLAPDQYQTTFQSRLGYTQWIEPYTHQALYSLIQKGIHHIAVTSPSFVVDCLETLEEINLRLRKQWATLGGETFIFIPSLNSTPIWIEALAHMIRHETSPLIP